MIELDEYMARKEDSVDAACISFVCLFALAVIAAVVHIVGG